MSQQKKDWDLCWNELSGTGCKSHNCRWRHVRSAGQLHSSPYQKRRGKVGYLGGDSLRKPEGPFYPVMQHQDGGIEDKYSLIDYPDTEDEHGVKFMMQLMRQRGNLYGSKNGLSDSSLISKASSKASTATSLQTSEVVSDSEGKRVSNIMVGYINIGKVQKLRQNRTMGEFQTPKHPRMESHTESSTTSVLSPLAKVFIPHFLMGEPNGKRIDGLKGSTSESQPTAETWLPGAVE